MTAAPDFERFVGDWLRADASADGSDRVLAATLTRVATAGQLVDTAAWHWRGHGRRVGSAALATAAVVVVAALGVALLPTFIRELRAPVIGPPIASPTATPSPSRDTLTVSGVRFSFMASESWERKGRISLNRSIAGMQPAEAMIYWTGFPDGDLAAPCGDLRTLPDDASAADLAAVMSAAPGTELVSGPADVIVDGRPAEHFVVTIRESLGCDPGYFFSWADSTGGALWPHTGEGATIRVWVVDVDSERLVVAGATGSRAVPWVPMTSVQRTLLEDQIQEIVGSIRFE